MTINSIEISKAFLNSGDDFKLTKYLKIKHPSIGEILKLGDGILCDKVYWNYVYILLCDPYDNMVWLDNNGIDFEEVTAFDVFVMRWDNCVKQYNEHKSEYDQYKISPIDDINEALCFFIGNYKFNMGKYENGMNCLYDVNEPKRQIDAELFNYIASFIQIINGITHNEQIRPANKQAKKILIEDMRKDQKKMINKASKDSDYLGNMISAVIYGGNGGITPFNFKKLKIYQLYSAMNVEQKKQHYNHVMNGVYQGTVSYDTVNKQEINWMI